jgi:maltose/moltooligosaccharide transporter
MGVYMGVFNFFIVIPEIIASVGFGPLMRLIFGENDPNAPLYVVMAGGICLLIASALVGIVRDEGGEDVPEGDVIRSDAQEKLLVQQTAQPVPSSGLVDEIRE